MTRTVAEKLLVKPGDALSVTGASAEERALLDPLPSGVTEAGAAEAAVAVVVVRSRDELLERFGSELPALGGARAVWFLYPKGGRADVNCPPSGGTVVRAVLPLGTTGKDRR